MDPEQEEQQLQHQQLPAPVVVRAYTGGGGGGGGNAGGSGGDGDDGDDGDGDGVVCVGDAIETDDQEGFLR
jgi:hypothetical protein